jgi:hypothetical protein
MPKDIYEIWLLPAFSELLIVLNFLESTHQVDVDK